MSSLYWIGALDAYRARINTNQCSKDNSFTETTCIYLIYGHNDISGIRNYLFDKIIYFKKEVKRNYPHALFKVIAMWIVLTIFVNPAWMSNHIHYDEWHEITYPFQMSTVRSLEFWELVCNFILNFIRPVITSKFVCWDNSISIVIKEPWYRLRVTVFNKRLWSGVAAVATTLLVTF